MTNTLPNERAAKRETIDSADLRAAKLRRASRAASNGREDAPGAGGAAEPDRTTQTWKLTKSQRAIVIRLLATHYYLDTVRAVLSADYPEIPPIGDSTMRYYRAQIDAGLLSEVEIARALSLKNGLANKAVRVQYMIRMVEQWRSVPLVEQATYFDDSGKQTTSYKTREGASREQRELLKQIALELGQLAAPGTPPAGDADALVDDDREAADLDLRNDLNELIAGMAERDAAADVALRLAARPEERL